MVRRCLLRALRNRDAVRFTAGIPDVVFRDLTAFDVAAFVFVAFAFVAFMGLPSSSKA
jgi:hypothetical protein